MYIDIWGSLRWVCLLMRARMWAFWDPSLFVFRFHVFWKWNEWLSLKSSVLLSLPSLHSLLMWLHFMFDLSGSLLIFVLFALPSSSFCFWFIPFILSLFFSYDDLFPIWYFLCIIPTHLVIRSFFFTASLLILYSHWAPSSPWLTSFSIHVVSYTWGHGFLTIGYLGLVSLHFYYLITLAYVMSCVLRPPWGHGIRCRSR